MYDSAGPRKPGRMAASREDPWISVSLLAENIFCQRAGIIQHETAIEDTGEEIYHAGRRGRRVFYDFKQLVRAMKRTLISTLIAIGLTIAFFIAGIIASAHSASISIGMVIIANVIDIFVGLGILRLLYLSCIYMLAKLASPSAPAPNHTESVRVKWWGLLNAGFQPIRPQDQYSDVQWHLVGHPWRVLVKGDLRIPVFKKRLNRGTAGEKLFRQHYARMAAYCHLIEKSENARSPYGIILFGDTHKGLTVPCQPGSKKAFHDGLIKARSTIANSNRFLPQYPSNQQICVLCPHSRRDRATGESVCGTRFGWTPPNYRDAYEYY